MSGRARRALSLFAGGAVAGAFLWLLLRETDAAALGETLGAASGDWVAVGVLLFLAGYAARIARWRAMLALENPALRWADCAGPFLIGTAANNLLPFRAGDALRAFAFTGRLGVGGGRVAATLLVERLLDLATLAAILAGALWITGLGAGAAGIGAGAAAALALLALGLALAPGLLRRPALAAIRALGGLAPGLAARAEAEAGRIFALLARLAEGRAMVRLLAWSALAWGLEGTVFLAAALALPAMAAPEAAALALPLGTLGTLLPSTPGHLGTFDYFVALAARAFGEAPSVAAAYALLVHAMLWLPATLAGGLCLLWRPKARAALAERMTEPRP